MAELPGDTASHMKQLEQETAKAGGDVMKAIQRLERQQSDRLISSAIQAAGNGEKDWEDTLAHYLGRNDKPWLLLLIWDRLAHDQQVKAIADAWTSAEFPERYLRRDEWLPMFREVGYIDENHCSTPSPGDITLWRGGVKKTRMSWTADREGGEWFAHRWDSIGKPGKLWTVNVGPDRLLAHFHEQHRNEGEYVIDPTGLRFKEVRRASKADQ
jgi:hypothetical protein